MHNSARSQMAEEYLRKFAGDRFEVESAGLEPRAINPLVAEVMREEGIELAGKKTNSVFQFYREGRRYHFIIAVCSKEAEQRCTHQEKLGKVREIRDRIREKIQEFARESSRYDFA